MTRFLTALAAFLLLAAPGGMSRTARQALGYKELIAHLHGECSLDEAVDLANASPYGLAAGLFTRDMSRGLAAARRADVEEHCVSARRVVATLGKDPGW